MGSWVRYLIESEITHNWRSVFNYYVLLQRFYIDTSLRNKGRFCSVPVRRLTFMGPCIANIFQYISNKTQLYIVYLYLETALHVSGGTSTHHQERKQLYLQHMVLVTPLLLPAAIAVTVWLIPGTVDTVVYRIWLRRPSFRPSIHDLLSAT
jgi:hypothetical protein